MGTPHILSKCNTGDFFGEPYAATPGAILNISVVAEEDCEILLLNVKRLLTSCPTACDHHQKLIRNLVSVLANKILLFNDKITHVSKRTTREKLLSYLLPNPSGIPPFPLTFPLTVSSWRIFSAWSVPPCRWSFPSCKKKGCWSPSGTTLSF